MIKLLKYLGIFLLSLIIALAVLLVVTYIRFSMRSEKNMELAGIEAPRLIEDQVPYRDLNKNGIMDPYEDPQRRDCSQGRRSLTANELRRKGRVLFY